MVPSSVTQILKLYLLVHCIVWVTIFHADFTKPLDPYDGQVALCPTDDTNSSDIFSTSFGLVGIYYQQYEAWKGIYQRRDGKPLGVYEADAICRQMGFTGAYPGTAVAISVNNHSFSNCL